MPLRAASAAGGPADNPGIDFSYRLIGSGWAEARIADETSSVEMTASYLTDALGDLLSALAALNRGDSHSERFSWDEEPAEHRWILRRDGDEVDLSILWFHDIYKPQPDEAGRLIFATRQPLAELVRAVSAAAAHLLEEVGEDGYRERWVEHAFPTAALAELSS
jgi:hypothetical protein